MSDDIFIIKLRLTRERHRQLRLLADRLAEDHWPETYLRNLIAGQWDTFQYLFTPKEEAQPR